MAELHDRRKAIAARLRSAREMAGLSQAQAAQELGLHRPSVSEMEAGRRSVATDELIQLADLYGVSVSWVTGESADKLVMADVKVELAARELAKLKPQHLDRLLHVLATLREKGSKK